jgi:hypothetical protein
VTGIDLKPVYIGFMVHKVTIGQVLLRLLRFFPVSVIPTILTLIISFIYHRRCKTTVEASLNKTLLSVYLGGDSNREPKKIKSEALSLKPSIFPLEKGRNKTGLASSNTNISFVRAYRNVLCDVVSRNLPSGQGDD